MKAEANVKYSIVVPLYNEVDNVPPLYSKITEVMRRMRESYEIIFVDDGSTDETFKVLAEIYDKDGHIVALRLRRNFGQTAALKAGFDLATGEIIISLDGDLQHDPEEIPLFIAKIEEGYDIVSGWRQERTDAWLKRRLPSCIANWTMSKLSGVELRPIGVRLFKTFSSTASCTVLFRLWPVGLEQQSLRSPSKIVHARTANRTTVFPERSGFCWILSASNFCWTIPPSRSISLDPWD